MDFFALEKNFVGHLKSEGIRLLQRHELIEGTTLIVSDLIQQDLVISVPLGPANIDLYIRFTFIKR